MRKGLDILQYKEPKNLYEKLVSPGTEESEIGKRSFMYMFRELYSVLPGEIKESVGATRKVLVKKGVRTVFYPKES